MEGPSTVVKPFSRLGTDIPMVALIYGTYRVRHDAKVGMTYARMCPRPSRQL